MRPSAPEPPVQLSVPSDARWLTVVRLTVSGVASRCGASYDEVDDLKVAVSEACTNAMEHAYPGADKGVGVICIRCTPGEGEIRIEVEDGGCGFDPSTAQVVEDSAPEKRGGLGLFLIRKLMDEVEVASQPGGGTRVIMVKRFAR